MEKVSFNKKRGIFMVQIAIIAVGAVVGAVLTGTMGMFYNLMIMPVIGIISFIALKRKSGIVLISIFILTYLWQIISLIAEGAEIGLWILQAGLSYGLIYMGLVTLGIIIAMLLNFAFRKEGVLHEK